MILLKEIRKGKKHAFMKNAKNYDSKNLRSVFIATLIFIVLALLFSVFLFFKNTKTINIEFNKPINDNVQLFYTSEGQPFSEKNSITQFADGLKVKFSIPNEFDSIRIDPGGRPVEIEIKSLQINHTIYKGGKLLTELMPVNHIANLEDKNGIVVFQSLGNDPHLIFKSPIGLQFQNYIVGILFSFILVLFFVKLPLLINYLTRTASTLVLFIRGYNTQSKHGSKSVSFLHAFLLFVFVFVLSSFGWYLFGSKTVKIELDRDVSGIFQIFYASNDDVFSAKNVSTVLSNDSFVKIPIPFRAKKIRIDPLGQSGNIGIKSIQVAGEKFERENLLVNLIPINQVSNFHLDQEGTLVFESTGNDPYLLLKSKIGFPFYHFIFLLFTSLLLSLIYYHRSSINPFFQTFYKRITYNSIKIRTTSLCLFSFLFIVACRWLAVGVFGVDIPFWDDWDGLGKSIFLPYFNHTLNLKMFFMPHNEHRLILTKGLSLLTLILNNNKWSPLLNMIIQALIPASTASFLIYCYKRKSEKISILTISIIVLVFAIPLSIENLLWGFLSQTYFVVLFAAITFWLATNPKLSWKGLFLCILVGFLASLSMGSGFTLPFVIGLVCLYYAITNKDNTYKWLLFSVLAFMACYFQSRLIVHVPAHEQLKAKNITDLIISFAKCLYWPFKNNQTIILMWIPTVAISIFFIIKQKFKFNRNLVYSFTLLCWTLLVMFATSYQRGGGGVGPAERHVDFFILIFPAVLFLIDAFFYTSKLKWMKIVITIQKFLILVLLLNILFSGTFNKLEADKYKKEQYLATVNYALNAEKHQAGSALQILQNNPIPYPNADHLSKVLSIFPEKYFPEVVVAPIQPVYSTKKIDCRPIYDTIPLSPCNAEIGTYIWGDTWQGEITSMPIVVKYNKIGILIAGNLIPEKLMVEVIEMPSQKIQLIDHFSVGFKNISVNNWRIVPLTLSKGTKEIVIKLHDKASGMACWVGVGGIISEEKKTNVFIRHLSYILFFLSLITALFIICESFLIKTDKTHRN